MKHAPRRFLCKMIFQSKSNDGGLVTSKVISPIIASVDKVISLDVVFSLRFR